MSSTANASVPPPPAASIVLPPPTVALVPSAASNGTSPAVIPPPRRNTELIALGVGVGLGGLAVLIAVGVFVLWYMSRKRRQALALSSGSPPPSTKGEPFVGLHQRGQPSAPSPIDHRVSILPNLSPLPGLPKNTFTYEELFQATDGFSNANFLGEGGFGYVHKGVLANGKEVAIKQLKVGSRQGEREFQAEIEIIGRIHHRHLVALVGYCISGDQRMLVYEFVPNKSLEFHLHGKGSPPLSWATRMKVALGAAKGLVYLHEDCQPKIIHRDIKAANILLDYNFEAKVADFGLARLSLDTDTHISTRVMGTFGYLAPEYALTGKLTEKSDIFSFGVMLLELITGRRPIDKVQFVDDDNIVDWARPLLRQALEDGNFSELADPSLQDKYDPAEMMRIVACASVCVRHLAQCRPPMSQIARALEGNMSMDDLNEGVRPGNSTVYGPPHTKAQIITLLSTRRT